MFGKDYTFTKVFSFFGCHNSSPLKFFGFNMPLLYEPKRNNIFLLNFQDIDEWRVRSITKPKYSERWEDITIELYDPIGPSTSQQLFNNLPKKRGVFTRGPLFSFNIKSLDPTGVIIEDWLINVKRVKLIDFGNLSYDNDDIQTVKIIIEPLDCVLNF
jgi:hypothetical protein